MLPHYYQDEHRHLLLEDLTNQEEKVEKVEKEAAKVSEKVADVVEKVIDVESYIVEKVVDVEPDVVATKLLKKNIFINFHMGSNIQTQV